MKETLDIFKRANFFPGLQAGPSFWNDITTYHFRKEMMYNYLFHGQGVVPDFLESLHVQAEKTKGGLITLLVARGLAFDGQGRPLFLYEPQVVVLDPKKFKLPTTVYVIIRYNEELTDFFQNKDNTDLQGYQSRVESVKIDVVSELSDTDTEIELARIRLSDEEHTGIAEIRNTNDFCNPGDNALDFRFIPWAARVKKGISIYLLTFLIDMFEYTRTIATTAYEALSLPSLRNMQVIAMTGKMLLQCTGVFFDDVIHLMIPLFDVDHQVLFDIAEYERTHEAVGQAYTSKEAYEQARLAMYKLGDMVKGYERSYEKIDAIVQMHRAVMDGLKAVLVTKEVSSDDIMYISYKMPQVLMFAEERYTLVDTLRFTSKESMESHNFTFIDAAHTGTSSEAFFYPDGVLVHDTVKRWVGGGVKFRLKNIIKGRKTLLIRRTDIHQGNYSVEVLMQGADSRTLVVDGVDTKNRWRNLFVSYDEGEIAEQSPVVEFKLGEKGRDNMGTTWIYQVL